MRKYIVIVTLLLCGIYLPLTAQQRDPNFKRELSLGVKGGVSIPSMAFSPIITQNTWVGAISGISLRYIEEKIFGLVVEANFTQRGWDELFEIDPYYYRRTLNYLEIPFLAHIYFGSDKVHGFVNLGPQVGVMLYDTPSSNFDINNPPAFSEPNKIKESYNMPVKNIFDYGITGGLGVELRLDRHIVLLEGRYYFGLGDIYGNRKSDVFKGSSANRGFLVSVAYMFRIW